jgi:hypothetical protein
MAKHTHDQLLKILDARFEKHMARHAGLEWAQVRARLSRKPKALEALQAMEDSGGEPDVVGGAQKSGAVRFVDCCAETPEGRRSLCYDRAALDARKEHKPAGSAVEMAAAMGVELLSEAQYRELQRVGEFDLKTSSWVRTPAEIRKLGGALFCDRRYDTVFVYHNGAQSYYAVQIALAPYNRRPSESANVSNGTVAVRIAFMEPLRAHGCAQWVHLRNSESNHAAPHRFRRRCAGAPVAPGTSTAVAGVAVRDHLLQGHGDAVRGRRRRRAVAELRGLEGKRGRRRVGRARERRSVLPGLHRRQALPAGG